MAYFIHTILVSGMLVTGQSLWKIGVTRYNFTPSKEYFLSAEFWRFVFSPQVIIGLTIYALATLAYMALLSKYQYSAVQAGVTSFALILAFVIAATFFGEKVTVSNLAGFTLIIVGVLLVTRS